jgi:SAM-dependent methyltransferase
VGKPMTEPRGTRGAGVPKAWTRDGILDLARSFQPACVLAAAADLDLFRVLAEGPLTAEALARRLDGDARATAILLDALAALRLLDKGGGRYSLPEAVAEALGRTGRGSVLAMAQHQANCLRRWAQLAVTVKSGRPCPRAPSVRGETADQDAFLLAMDDLASSTADSLIRFIEPLAFRCLLDVGGASGTWTVAFLRACAAGRAVLFDLPAAIPLARRRLADEGLSDRVTLVSGDFYDDPLPPGADLAWVSAIVHQNSRAENRELFRKVAAALVEGGRVAIRDVLMEPSRTEPPAGALFAVNMLVGSEGGGTYTVEELRGDLDAAGFGEAEVAHREPSMNSILIARKR